MLEWSSSGFVCGYSLSPFLWGGGISNFPGKILGFTPRISLERSQQQHQLISTLYYRRLPSSLELDVSHPREEVCLE